MQNPKDAAKLEALEAKKAKEQEKGKKDAGLNRLRALLA